MNVAFSDALPANISLDVDPSRMLKVCTESQAVFSEASVKVIFVPLANEVKLESETLLNPGNMESSVGSACAEFAEKAATSERLQASKRNLCFIISPEHYFSTGKEFTGFWQFFNSPFGLSGLNLQYLFLNNSMAIATINASRYLPQVGVL